MPPEIDTVLAMLATPGPWLTDALLELGYPQPQDVPDLVARLEPVEEGSRRWKVRRKGREKALRHLTRWLESRR